MCIPKSYFLIFISIVITKTNAKPFLLGQTSLTSLFGSSSSQPQPESYIVDLRTPKQSRIRENLKVNEEDDDFYKAPVENSDPTDAEDGNEALPSLVQKKIGKILHKLQLFSSIRSTINNSRGVQNTNNEDAFEFDVNDEEDGVNMTSNEAIKYPSRIELLNNTYLPAEEVQLDGEESNLESEISNNGNIGNVELVNDSTSPVKGNINVSPGSVAVFFTELVGTLVGLAYGAAAQITSATTNKPV